MPCLLQVGAEAVVRGLAQKALQIVGRCNAKPTRGPQQSESLIARISGHLSPAMATSQAGRLEEPGETFGSAGAGS